MTQARHESEGRRRRLTAEFDGWLTDRSPRLDEFFADSLVVLDTNVLLSLYEVGKPARREILSTLQSIQNRLWIPNQVALEFSRRRRQVVLDRTSSYKRIKTEVSTAATSAADVIEAAVDRVLALRERSRTNRAWDLAAASLDRKGIEERFSGIMDAALAELQALDAEQDLSFRDIRDGDPILTAIDDLLLNRIGEPYSSDQLRTIVNEAISFRYPNSIPPGYLDADKATAVRAAGDYILWRQIIDEAARVGRTSRRVLLITSDLKEDWWTLSSRGKPLKARPELTVELYQNSDADLALIALADFLEGAQQHLFSQISEGTVDQIRTATSNLDIVVNKLLDSPDQLDLLELPPAELEALVSRLFIAMGYDLADEEERSVDGFFDLLLTKTDAPFGKLSFAVEVKRYRSLVGLEVVQKVVGAMQITHANKGIVVSTSSFFRTGSTIGREIGN